MAESPESQEPEAEAVEQEPSARRASRIQHAVALLRAVGTFIPRLLLGLFMVALPLALIAYPAWRLSARLVDYAAATTVEAELKSIDVRTVELGQDQTSLFEARKHYDVVFHLQAENGKAYASVLEMSWPVAGLKRKLENLYPVGDPYTLYLLPDHTVALEEVLAKDSIDRLTGLMALVLAAFAVLYLLWKRLAHRLPAVAPRFPIASMSSLLVGQAVTLAIAGLFAVLISFSPQAIPASVYLAAYWGLALVLSLCLRLLVFENPPPPRPEPEAAEDGRRSRQEVLARR